MDTITVAGGTLNTQEIGLPTDWDENGYVGAGSFIQSGGTVDITARGSYGETEKWVWDEQAQENVCVGIVDHYHYYGLANYEGGYVEISGGTVNVEVNCGYAVTADNLTVTGDAQVELNGHLVTHGTLDFAHNASVRVTNGGFHIANGGVMSIDGGAVSVSDDWEYEYENDYPIANNVERGSALIVSGGKLTLEHDNFRVGLNLDGDFTLNGGEVTVTSTNANDNQDDQVSYAIRSQGITTINDGVLNLRGTIGYNQFYDGSNTDTKLTVNGGTITWKAW